MIRKIISLAALLCATSSAPAGTSLFDINSPITLCMILREPTNCNTIDAGAGSPLHGELLDIYLAVKKQTGIQEFTILHERFEPLPNRIRFSESGEGCPYGIVSYCHNIMWAHKTKSGKWVVEKRK